MDERLDANRRRYDKLSGIYARLLWMGSAGRITRLYQAIAAELDVPRDGLVVELGCGPATVTPTLLAALGDSGRVIGVDLAPAMIERARRRAREEGWARVHFECADARHWSPPEPAAAVVFCLSLTTMPDCRGCLEHALAMLAPGGQLLILDSIPDPARRVASLVMRLKAPLVGATPTRVPLEFGARHLEQLRTRPFFGGVYSLIAGRKSAGVAGERAAG